MSDERQVKTINHALNSTEQNYLRHIIWTLTLEANKCGTPPKKYIEENLDIITFNYDVTADVLLKKYHEFNVISINEEIIADTGALDLNVIKIVHVYSYLGANGKVEPANIEKIFDLTRIIMDPVKEISIEEHIKQCDKYIFWIRHESQGIDKLKELSQQLITDADNIYFLGFGFDKNNMINIGLDEFSISKRDFGILNLGVMKKTLFISRASSKIMSIFMTHLGIEIGKFSRWAKLKSRYGDNNVFYTQHNDSLSRITFSKNYINTAFYEDFDI